MKIPSASAQRPLVAAYYFPNYHADPRNALVHGQGWTEWDLVNQATPRFPGHQQPLAPLWGCENEADPGVMARKIDAAADHGVDCFIFDWYHYNDGPFLERCLEEGFLRAPNVERIKFCCMWANHDWHDIHPAKQSDLSRLLYPGSVTPATFDTICDVLIDRYFSHPSHLLVNGAPYFSIYDVASLVNSLGGSVLSARKALDRFREKVRAAGFPDLHLNAIGWNCGLLKGEAETGVRVEDFKALGFDSIGGYVWVHYASLNNTGKIHSEYGSVRDAYLDAYHALRAKTSLPVFPNVTMGWDSTPRTVQSESWAPDLGYPFTSIMKTSPAEFREALTLIKKQAQAGPDFQMVSLNAWNEWTEGSYLEPDKQNGWAYLEAIRSVFGLAQRPIHVPRPGAGPLTLETAAPGR
jgi:hypothetical protein